MALLIACSWLSWRTNRWFLTKTGNCGKDSYGLPAIRKEVREAIPVVVQHPNLPGQLLDVNENTPAAMNEALSRYSKEVQEAAKKLTTYREVLEILMSQALTELIGVGYATHGPEKFREIVKDSAKKGGDGGGCFGME